MFKIDNETNTISIIRKDSAIFSLSIDNYVLSDGDVLKFTVAGALDLPQSEAAIYKEISSFTNGVADIILESLDTDLQAGEYLYDIQINSKDGRVSTIVGPAKFKVLGGVSY